jgi:hypothetical protein
LDAKIEQYDMEVELTLFTLEEGGLKEGLPLETDFDGPRIYIDGYEFRARFTLQDRRILYPGETVHVFVTFFFTLKY